MLAEDLVGESEYSSDRLLHQVYGFPFAMMLAQTLGRGAINQSGTKGGVIRVIDIPFRFPIYVKKAMGDTILYGVGFVPWAHAEYGPADPVALAAFKEAVGYDWASHENFVLPLDVYPPRALEEAARQIGFMCQRYQDLAGG